MAAFCFTLDGSKRFIDGYRAHRMLHALCGGDANEVIALTRSENPEQAARFVDTLVEACRKAFQMPGINFETGEGYSEDEVLDVFHQFQDWVEKKSDTRILAELASVYGSSVLPSPIDDDLRFGLWLNLPRIRLQRALEVAMGWGIMANLDPLPREWFDAMAPLEEQVENLRGRVNAERFEAKASVR